MKILTAFKIIAVSSLVTLASCSSTQDYSGTYSGDLISVISMTGSPDQTIATAVTYDVFQSDGTYYLADGSTSSNSVGFALEGSGSSYSYTVSDPNLSSDFTMFLEFSADDLTINYSLEEIQQGTTITISVSGVLDKVE